MSDPLRDDYESLVLTGVKRVTDVNGRPLLNEEHLAALDRLIACGLAAREGDAFVLRRPRDADIQFDEHTERHFDSLHTVWLRIDDDTESDDEILYGELGYWQHWANVLNDGTDRKATPLTMDMMVPEAARVLSRQWTKELDPTIVDYVFSNKLVNVRLLVPPAAHGAAVETMIEAVRDFGVQVRVFPSTLEVSLFDNKAVVIHEDQRGAQPERYRLTRRRAVVEPFMHLFEMRWSAAIPWTSFVRGTGGVLDLLAQGWTDARIAAALGLSPRTVSRRIAEMMRAAGAQSRFELGMKYARQEFRETGRW